MSMSKQDFVALADAIKHHNQWSDPADKFTENQLIALGEFCKARNANFLTHRWHEYIAGKCGLNGGAIKRT